MSLDYTPMTHRHTTQLVTGRQRWDTQAERKHQFAQDTRKGVTPAGRKHHPHTGYPKGGDTCGGGIYNLREKLTAAAAYVIV